MNHLFKKVTKMKWDDLNLEKNYPGTFTAYAHSKLANCLFTVEAAERFGKDGVSVVSVHPGMVNSSIVRDLDKRLSVSTVLLLSLYPWFVYAAKTNWQGAQTTIHCAVDENIPAQNGKYFV